MFSYLYSNWIYFLLLLYSPKDNNKSFDDQISGDVQRSDFLRPKTSFGRRSADNKCLDANRIQTFVKISVENLIQKLRTIVDNSTEPEVSIQSRISVRHLNILRQYLPQDYDYLNCEQLEEFEDSINEFIESLGTVSDDHKSGDNSYFVTSLLSINFLKAFLYLSSLLLSALLTKQLIDVLVRRRDLFPRLLCRKSLLILTLISLVLLSIVWKWRQKYLIELSRKQCYVLAAPEECLNRHSELSFVSWIRHYIYGYEQRRHDYYRAVTVDPFWEINPLTVISELLSDVVFTPLQPLGHNSGIPSMIC